MRNPSNPNDLVSVDDDIDAIAREALEEARRTEEALRYRNNPGPIIAPDKPLISSSGLSAGFAGSSYLP
jgi:hypothetical protein